MHAVIRTGGKQYRVAKDDVITAVDGVAASQLKLPDVRGKLRTAEPGTVVTFTVNRGGASAAEIWSTADLLQTLAEAKRYKAEVDARLVWTRFRAQTREAQAIKGAVQSGLKLHELQVRLGYRVAFSEALARGLSAEECSDRNAKAEVFELAEEVKKILAEKEQ